jgi:hypothetical protein
MFARLEIDLRKPLELEEARAVFLTPKYLAPNDPTALNGTLFADTAEAAAAFVVYSSDNGGYIVIALWRTAYSLEVVVEPGTARVRRAADETWRAVSKILEEHRGSLDTAYLIEEGPSSRELERGLVAFQLYLKSAFTLESLSTAFLTLVLSVWVATNTDASGGEFALAAVPAISVFAVGVVVALRRFLARKLVWETLA